MSRSDIAQPRRPESFPVTVKLPGRFYRDHASRGLPAGTVKSQTAAYVVVELDPESWDDLVSDARSYAEAGTQWFGPGASGLIASAKATLRHLAAVTE